MKNALHKTKNDLPEAARAKVVELLNSRLATAIDLQTQAKQAHWNVKGPQFIALHELFDKVNEMAEEAVDDLAERAVQLGGVALGTARVVAKESGLREYPLTATSGTEHVEALSSAIAAFGTQVRSAIALADELGDAGTTDLFTRLSQDADKQLWFVEAHAQGR
jgi:starvation-inducible DNA-binding protein